LRDGEEHDMSGLALLSHDLDTRLQHASSAQKRAASLVACQYAVGKLSLRHPLVSAALEGLQVGQVFQPDLKAKLDALSEGLDAEYLTLKEAAEQGCGDRRDYVRLFAQARAVAALSCAGDQDVQKAGDAIYEAAFSFESDDKAELFSLVEAELDK